MNQHMDTAILLVGMNTREYVKSCLQSITATRWGNYTHQILYVDNNSKDDSVAMVRGEFPDVQVLANSENIGFCRAANQASAAVSARHLLHLNNDNLVYPDSIVALAEFMDVHAHVSIAGCRLLNHDLTDQWSARRFPSGIHSIWGRRSWLARRFPRGQSGENVSLQGSTQPGTAVSGRLGGHPLHDGAPRSLPRLNSFPADFYYWHEAIFCRRNQWQGGETWVVPTSRVIHFEGKGGGARSYAVRRWHVIDFHRGAYRFYVESRGMHRLHAGRWVAAAGLGARASLLLLAIWFQHSVLERATA